MILVVTVARTCLMQEGFLKARKGLRLHCLCFKMPGLLRWGGGVEGGWGDVNVN